MSQCYAAQVRLGEQIGLLNGVISDSLPVMIRKEDSSNGVESGKTDFDHKQLFGIIIYLW